MSGGTPNDRKAGEKRVNEMTDFQFVSIMKLIRALIQRMTPEEVEALLTDIIASKEKGADVKPDKPNVNA